MHVHQGRQLLAWGDIPGAIEQRRDLPSVEGLVPDVLRVHEDLPIDRPVLGVEERLGRVRREVVRDERGARDVRRIVDEKLRVVREELRAESESGGQLELSRFAGVDLVEDRPDLRLLVADGHEPIPALGEPQGMLLDAVRRVPADLPGLDIHDPGSILSRRVARRRDVSAIRMPVAQSVLRPGAHAEDLPGARPVRTDDVPVAVLQVGEVLVRDVADPLAVV